MLERLRRSEVVFTLVLMTVGCVVIYMSLKLGFGRMKSPGTGFFPFFVGCFILLVGAYLIVGYLIEKKTPECELHIFNKGELGRFLGMSVSFCAWVVFMPLLGFIVMTFLATFSFAKIMGMVGWLRPIILSASTSVFIFFLFDVWFYTDLPRGILG